MLSTKKTFPFFAFAVLSISCICLLVFNTFFLIGNVGYLPSMFTALADMITYIIPIGFFVILSLTNKDNVYKTRDLLSGFFFFSAVLLIIRFILSAMSDYHSAFHSTYYNAYGEIDEFGLLLQSYLKVPTTLIPVIIFVITGIFIVKMVEPSKKIKVFYTIAAIVFLCYSIGIEMAASITYSKFEFIYRVVIFTIIATLLDITRIFNGYNSDFKHSYTSLKKIIIVVIGIVFIVTFGVLFSGDTDFSSEPKSPYADVFKKDPNNWTEDEKEYVDGFFEWHDEQYKD